MVNSKHSVQGRRKKYVGMCVPYNMKGMPTIIYYGSVKYVFPFNAVDPQIIDLYYSCIAINKNINDSGKGIDDSVLYICIGEEWRLTGKFSYINQYNDL